MAQQNIDFGSFPDDPDADAIRTAFQKVQNNFSELYATTTAGSVTSVNRGAGITVNSPTGSVIVTANIAAVTLNTNSLRMGSTPANSSLTASITQTSQAITIDIDPANVFSNNFAANSTGGLANFTGTLTANSNSQPNITSVGTLTSLAVTGNVTAGNVYANSGTLGATNLIGTLNANSNSQPNITTIGTLGNLNVTSNSNLGNLATANFFSGDGHLLSNLTITAGSSITNGNSNVIVSANGNVATSVAGTANVIVVTSTGANVNGYLTASGNITGANANLGNAVTASYFIGNLYGQANTAVTAGTVTTNAQPNITSVGTLSALTVTANITAGNVYANSGIVKGQYLYGDGSNISNITISAGSSIVNGTSNVSIPASNGNVNTVVAGNTTLVVTGTGVNVAGTLNATGSITGNFGGNVTNATQANITSLGTLTSLTVSGVTNLGAVGNVTITGGTANYYLMTNGSGGLSWTNALLTPIPGSNTQVIFNDDGAANASSSLTFNKTTGALTATLLGGTLTTNAQTNITSIGTLGNLIVTSNINAGFFKGEGGNISNVQGSNVSGTVSSATTAGTVTTAAQGNITSLGTLTSLSVSGNANVGNLGATGNIISNNSTISTTASVGGLLLGPSNRNANFNVAVANTGYIAGIKTGPVTYTDTGTGGTVAMGAINSLVAPTVQGTTFATIYTNLATLYVSNAPTIGSSITVSNRWAVYVGGGSSYFGGNVTMANVITGGLVTATGNITGGNVVTTGAVSAGSLTTTSITTGENTTAGSITGNWTLTTGSRLQATYADLAEYYAGSEQIEPGTVVEFGGTHEVQVCNSFMSTLVAGIVTTDPAYIMNAEIDCEYPTAIALQGRIPAKVIGPVKRGDLMVSTNNGYAISCNTPAMGTVLGKAITDFTGEIGVVEIMVGRT